MNVTLVSQILGWLAAFATIITLIINLWPRLQVWRDRVTIRRHVGMDFYTREDIKRATSLYIKPDVVSLDPSGEADLRHVVAIRGPIFIEIDRLLDKPIQYKFLFLLADSGMGKTSFLLNYYARHLRTGRRKKYTLYLFPLNTPNLDEYLAKISREDRIRSVLFLDALDEDRRAINDHHQRIDELLKLTDGFRTVLITCRTQFFTKEEEIPVETGVLKLSARPMNEEQVYYFHKLYLAPFSDQQVTRFIHKKYPLFQRKMRRPAQMVVKNIYDLAARPMVLAYIDDLIQADHEMKYLFQVYETLVDAWLKRERGFVKDIESLRKFCEQMALFIFENCETLRVPEADLKPLAEKFGIELAVWQLRGRSLLNRDVAGNYKFAHRSIMEYLFVYHLFAKGINTCQKPWTDLMKQFAMEMIQERKFLQEKRFPLGLSRADFSGVNLKSLNLDFIKLNNANLSNADLRQASLKGADLTGINFNNANLEGIDLFVLKEAQASGANLTGAKFDGVDLIRQIEKSKKPLREYSTLLEVLAEYAKPGWPFLGQRNYKRRVFDAVVKQLYRKEVDFYSSEETFHQFMAAMAYDILVNQQLILVDQFDDYCVRLAGDFGVAASCDYIKAIDQEEMTDKLSGLLIKTKGKIHFSVPALAEYYAALGIELFYLSGYALD
jgi:uncharacterized protein YjbI with pentapeptide repeats